MVALPLFKLASLFVRHVSKYGANRIKLQAHEHPDFRRFAARYGQVIHQLNMRLSVALLRNVEAEIRAREKAEAPTVKTKEETEKEIRKEETAKAKMQEQEQHDSQPKEEQGKTKSNQSKEQPKSVWKRKFRPLPEAKAVDLFADVVGDAFILVVAGGLVIYEYYRSSSKPDHNLERIKELDRQLEELKKKEEDRKRDESTQESRILAMERALRAYRDPKTKQPLLPEPTPAP